MAKGIIIFSSTVAICAVIVIIVLISVSYRKVEMTEVALLYSHASRRIDREKLYGAGRYYVGVGGEFIAFPLTQREMELPIFESRTADGLKIELQVSLNYKIEENKEKILAIYDHFGINYDGFLSRLAMNIIRDAAATFVAFEFSTNRSQVSLKMESDIRDDMESIGLRLESVQLLNINFPRNYSNTLQNTLMLQQQVTQAERDKAAEIVSLEGELSKANITAEGIISDAMSQATTIRNNADADAEALNAALDLEGSAHMEMIKLFYDQVGDYEKARKLFVQWYWMNMVSSSQAAKQIAVGIPPDFVNMPSP